MLKKRNEDTGIAKVGQELLGRSPKPYMLGQKNRPPTQRPSPPTPSHDSHKPT